MDSVVKTFQPALDSIKAASRMQMDRLLTPEQHARLEARRKDDAARHAAERKRQKPPCGK
jgi:Spy/CpxP family protein refolding chaperone